MAEEEGNHRIMFVEFVARYQHQLILPRLAAPLPLPAWFARCIMGELPMNELSSIELDN